MRISLVLFLLLSVSQAAANPSADELIGKALTLAGSGRLDDAERVLLEGYSAYPRDSRFPTELAGVAWRKKQSMRAKTYLRQSLHLNGADAYANEFLGSLYHLDGNLYAALKYWNRVQRPVLSGVVFVPEPLLHPAILARLPAVSAGQLLTGSRLAQTERNLNRLRIFSDSSFELSPSTGEEYQLAIRSPALSQPLSGVAGRLLPLLRGLPYQQINLDWINIRRSAATFLSIWRWDPNKRRIAIGYRTPFNSGTYTLWSDVRDEKWDLSRVAPGAFGVRSATLGGEAEFVLSRGVQWTPGILLSRHLFENGGSEPEFANSTLWELRNRFTLPRWRYPERRLELDVSLTSRTGHIFSRASSRLIGAEFDASARWLPQQRGDLYAVRTRLRAGVISGNLPVDEYYATAMERDNDLWLRGHVGTRDGRKGISPMGARFVLQRSEISRRLFRVPFLRVDVGPFFDLANVGGTEGLGSRGWLYDTGALASMKTLGGFRFSVVYGRDIRNGNNVMYTAVSR